MKFTNALEQALRNALCRALLEVQLEEKFGVKLDVEKITKMAIETYKHQIETMELWDRDAK